MDALTGGCLCGARRYRLRQAPAYAGYCHCSMCRKATGGASAILARVSARDLEWTGKPPAIFRSSPIATRGFCPDCGTPLFLDYDDDDKLRLTIGSLDHPENVVPQGHYGIESRLPWDDSGKGLPAEETKERF